MSISGVKNNTDNNIYNKAHNSGASASPNASGADFSQVFTTVIHGTQHNSGNAAGMPATNANSPTAETLHGALQSTDPVQVSNAADISSKVVDLDAIFQKAADSYNVPVSLLKAMAKTESNFNANAVSPCGAMGIMQLMPSTAQALGVSDAFDPEQNIMGGAKYISGKLEQYDGDVTLALAAYNAGSGNVKKYGGVPPFNETKNYINKVVGYMGNDISAGSAVINKAVTANSLGNPINAYAGLVTGSIKDSASDIVSGSINNTAADLVADIITGSVPSTPDSLGSLSDLSVNLLANSGISFETLAGTGLMSDWLAAASLTEDEDDGSFSDLINAYNRYNRMTITPVDESKNNEEA